MVTRGDRAGIEQRVDRIEARLERELGERLDALERREEIMRDPASWRPQLPTKQEAAWENHLATINRHLAALDRNEAVEKHRRHHRREITRGEGERDRAEQAIEALNEREVRIEAELAAERSRLVQQRDAADKRLEALQRPSEPGEDATRELQAVSA